MQRRFANLLLWVAIVAEIHGYDFEDKWSTWLTPITTAAFRIPSVHLPAWDILAIGTMLLGVSKGGLRKGVATPLLASIRVTLIFLALSWLWGMVRGGSAYQSLFQIHAFLMQFVVAAMVMTTCKTVAHVAALGRVIIFAALYRSLIVITFYLQVARFIDPPLATLTNHHDSVTFAGCTILLLAYALHRRTAKAWLTTLAAAAPMLVATQLNNRRLAWLMVAVGLVLIYALLPPDRFKRVVSRVLLVLAPVPIAYLVAGWGHSEGIFKPVGSISTMFGEHQDTSSIMRDIENYNLMVTLRESPLLGMGWGHEYVEAVRAIDISSLFPQYRYMPHNSLLAAVAFTGAFFAGIWQIYPVTCFFLLRAYRTAQERVIRVAAVSAYLALIVCSLQMWGDVGFQDAMTNIVMGICVGLGGKLPILADAWPPKSKSVQTRSDVRDGEDVSDREPREPDPRPA